MTYVFSHLPVDGDRNATPMVQLMAAPNRHGTWERLAGDRHLFSPQVWLKTHSSWGSYFWWDSNTTNLSVCYSSQNHWVVEFPHKTPGLFLVKITWFLCGELASRKGIPTTKKTLKTEISKMTPYLKGDTFETTIIFGIYLRFCGCLFYTWSLYILLLGTIGNIRSGKIITIKSHILVPETSIYRPWKHHWLEDDFPFGALGFRPIFRRQTSLREVSLQPTITYPTEMESWKSSTQKCVGKG